VKPLDQSDANQNEYPAHHQRAHNPPKQYFVLVIRRNPKIPENEQENEEIIDAQR